MRINTVKMRTISVVNDISSSPQLLARENICERNREEDERVKNHQKVLHFAVLLRAVLHTLSSSLLRPARNKRGLCGQLAAKSCAKRTARRRTWLSPSPETLDISSSKL
jgi:hypothetical protein